MDTPRVSQRRTLSCQECTKRKRKCDKQIPCSRCRRLGINCSREVIQIRRNVVKHSAEINFLGSIVNDLESSMVQVPHVVTKLKSRISFLQSGEETASQDMPQEQTLALDCGIPLQNVTEPLVDHPDPSLLTALEHLAWGRNSAGCFPHRECSCSYRRDCPSMNSKSFQLDLSFKFAIRFPDAADAEKLIRFHLCRLAWHHNCLHAPTFLEQCEVFWKTGRCDHPLWMAVYFSILSSTVCSVQNSEKSRKSIDVDFNKISAPHLFSTMVHILYNFNFLDDVSIYSVQAIVISTEAAHNLGLSQFNATLFNAAVRIAECLGIHRISDHQLSVIRTQDEWDELVEREVGKRVWCQMVVQDYFAIPFTDTYSIPPMHFSTNPPLNADDYDLSDMPATVPTISIYNRVLREMAAIMPDLVDGLGPMKQRKPLQEQYEHILRMDQKLRSVVRNIPSFLLSPDREREAEIPWLSIAQRSLAITAAEKIIMIHRPFLLRSFHSSLYSHSRRTCVAAAMTILREHETITRDDDASIWTHTAFCITASVILCFAVNATADDDDTGMHKTAIINARTRLALRQGDVLAQRGVALIDAIFIQASGSKYNSGEAINFNEIISNFSTLSRLAPLHDFIPVDDEIVEMDNVQFDLGQMETDFDTWFSGIFSDIGCSF